MKSREDLILETIELERLVMKWKKRAKTLEGDLDLVSQERDLWAEKIKENTIANALTKEIIK